MADQWVDTTVDEMVAWSAHHSVVELAVAKVEKMAVATVKK